MENEKKNILVSACLIGKDCRYKGDNCKCDKLLELESKYNLIPVCPEQLGGLSTPRDPAERVKDKVISSKGKDVTAEYNKGAEIALETARANNVEFCVLKSRSPSCGKGVIYDGTFTGGKIAGNGVTTDLLIKNGYRVLTEEDL